MSQLLLFTLLMCDQIEMGSAKCIRLHKNCVLSVNADMFPPEDPKAFCDKAISNAIWEKAKKYYRNN